MVWRFQARREEIRCLRSREATMAHSYSQDLRERVLDEALGGGSARGTAARFGLGAATAITWVSRARDTGERTARRQGHPVGSKLDDEADDRLELIDQTPDLTLDEIKARLKHELKALLRQA